MSLPKITWKQCTACRVGCSGPLTLLIFLSGTDSSGELAGEPVKEIEHTQEAFHGFLVLWHSISGELAQSSLDLDLVHPWTICVQKNYASLQFELELLSIQSQVVAFL